MHIRRAARCAVLLLTVFAAPPSALAGPRIMRVDAACTGGSHSGNSWDNALTDLQQAIDAAVRDGGGEIWVRAGVYRPSGDGRDSTFELRPGIRLYGGFRGVEQSRDERNPKANRTILNGDIGATGSEADNCFHIITAATDTVVDGFIITRGNANGVARKGTGGGIFIPKSARKVVIAGCTFERNTASWQGGAVFGEDAEAEISDCAFFSNAAAAGGALAFTGSSRLGVTACSFSSNTAQSLGGAILLEGNTDAGITACRFLYNSSRGSAGALAVTARKESILKLSLTDCAFSDNRAQGTGGAVEINGPVAPIIGNCIFERNSAFEGAGGVALSAGTTAVIHDCTFTGNRGLAEMVDIGKDDTATLLDSTEQLAEAEPEVPEPKEPEPPPRRKIADVRVYDLERKETALPGLVSEAAYTLLLFGDLSDPGFIRSYRVAEAAARDYAPFDIRFFYLCRALRHPENNGWLQPYSLTERIRLAQVAGSLLSTRIPWLCDDLDNRALIELAGDSPNNAFLYDSSGGERFAGRLEDAEAFRTALKHIVGLPSTTTAPLSLPAPRIEPLRIAPPELVDRIRFNPEKESFTPLRITPVDSDSPFYTKLRAEGSARLLKTGSGRLYIGFHLDPLYRMQWDNTARPVRYLIQSVTGLAAPSTDTAPEIRAEASDSEPREFLLSTRDLDLGKPLMLQVDYAVVPARQGRRIEVSQRYMIHLEADPLGGAAYRRQLAYEDPVVRREPITLPGELRQHDANGDGRLTRGELSGNLWSRFPDMDTNRDGYLSQEEYNAYQRKR